MEGCDQAVAALSALHRVPEICPDWVWTDEPQALRLWSPNAWLMESVRGLKPGLSLDLGCGSGRDAVALAARGCQVVAVDRLPEILERGKLLQSRYAPTSPPVDWVHADLRKCSPIWPLTARPSLVCSLAYFDLAVLQFAWEMLAPGGTLLVECFTDEHFQRYARPRRGKWTPWPAPEDAGSWSVDYGWRDDGRHTARLTGFKALS